jgi:hypothetical protein
MGGEAEERGVARAIKEWLEIADNRRWLLVLDNYDDIRAVDIRYLLPNSDTGHVIITSRRSNLQKLGGKIAVSEIDELSAISLFLKSADREEVSVGGKYESHLVLE